MKKANWLMLMNKYRVTQRLSVAALVLLATILIFARSRSGSHVRPALLINGASAEYARFSIYSKGVLSLIAANPETDDAQKIPFRIYVRRGNSPIRAGQCSPAKVASGGRGATPGNSPIRAGQCRPGRLVYEVEVSPVLATAKAGDYLVIEPVRKEDAGAVQVIQLTDYFQPIIRLFPTPKGDGC